MAHVTSTHKQQPWVRRMQTYLAWCLGSLMKRKNKNHGKTESAETGILTSFLKSKYTPNGSFKGLNNKSQNYNKFFT